MGENGSLILGIYDLSDWLFLFCYSDLNILHCFLCFVVNILAVHLLCTVKTLIFLIPWVKAWHLLFVYIKIKLGQCITDQNLRETQPYFQFFYSFWFCISLITHIYDWLINAIARCSWSYNSHPVFFTLS